MPHDQVEVVVSLSLSTHHNMVNQSLISASLNTKPPTGMHSTCWFYLELGGRVRGKVLELGYGVSAFNLLTRIWRICYMNLGKASKSSGEFLFAPKTLWVTASWSKGSRQGSGEQAYSKTAPVYTHTYSTLLGLFWQGLVTPSLREPLRLSGKNWKSLFDITETQVSLISLVLAKCW